MKIQFSKHSGWTPPRFFEIDTNDLASGERQQVEKLVHLSAILTTPDPVDPGKSRVRDGDEYILEITTATGTYHWQWYGIGGPKGPDGLLDLLRYCNQRATPKKK